MMALPKPGRRRSWLCTENDAAVCEQGGRDVTAGNGLLLPDLAIKGFRGIEDLTIPRLGRVTLLAGKNGIGKTTVLEAVRIYASRGRLLLYPVSWMTAKSIVLNPIGKAIECMILIGLPYSTVGISPRI